MNLKGQINISDFDYDLPHHRIAEHPVEARDHSKLLVTDHTGINDAHFYDLPAYMPEGGMMVFNDTRVIRARLIFRKDTGARIEIFCLEPLYPSAEIITAFEAVSPVTWKCLIGNAKKWTGGRLVMTMDGGKLCAEKMEASDGTFLIHFSWEPEGRSFATVLESAGKVPLPPYIEREAVEEDAQRYQTIYAMHNGSVAAPTAGLHFTPGLLEKLQQKDISFHYVTLHVGAGTFKPVDKDNIRDHQMHNEQIIIHRSLVEGILGNKGPLTAVGTTSMRTLESLYWYGTLLHRDRNAPFSVDQWLPYDSAAGLPVNAAMEAVLSKMDRDNVDELAGDTRLIIVPGYTFRIADILLTNFHMPRSTLLLLVAAFSGRRWKDAYDHALKHDFRFLSYGDSCLFFRNDQIL